MISIVIIASNNETTIKKCLDSVKEFKDVVLYLNNSTDGTKKIAENYSNVRVIEGYFDGFGNTKNRAISYAKNDWVFVLDSDEYFSKELVKELNELLLDDRYCYSVKRINLFLGEEVRFSGWGNDWVIRLFNKRKTKFLNVEVHESVIVDSLKVKKLNNKLYHMAVSDIRDFLLKVYRYSDMKRKKNKVYSPFIIFFKACFSFIKTYFFKLGFLDGYKGLVIAVSNFNGTFFKHMINYVKNKNKVKK